MWHTSEGNRTLHGAEAALVKTAITRMAETCVEERDFSKTYEYEITIYDELDHEDRLRILEVVATHLLMPTYEPLKLSAVVEATVGAIFAQLRIQVECEIDMADEGFGQSDDQPWDSWCTMILAALHERRCESPLIDETETLDTDWYPESNTWPQLEQWGNAIEFLADQILWDRDYELVSLVVDQPPDVATTMKSFLGINDEYFIDPGPNDIATLDDRNVLERIQAIGPQSPDC